MENKLQDYEELLKMLGEPEGAPMSKELLPSEMMSQEIPPSKMVSTESLPIEEIDPIIDEQSTNLIKTLSTQQPTIGEDPITQGLNPIEMPDIIEPEVDGAKDEVASGKKQDNLMRLIENLDKSLSHFDAANPNYKLNPVTSGITLAKDAEANALKQRSQKASTEQKEKQQKLLEDYRERQLSIRQDSQKLREKSLDESRKFRERQFDQRGKAEGRREEAQDRRLNKDIYGVVKDYKSNKLVKELDTQGLSFAQADDLLAAMVGGNEIALGALGTKMARAMGEVGVLTDADVKRYIQAQSAVRGAKDSAGRVIMGKLSESTVKDIKDVTDKMAKGFTKRRAELKTEYIDYAYENFGKPAGMTQEQIEERFGLTSGAPTESPVQESEFVMLESPDGQRAKVKKENIQKYLDKGAKIIEE